MFGFELFESPQGGWEAPNSGDAADVSVVGACLDERFMDEVEMRK